MRTRESEEMYLETILFLKNKNGKVKSIHVAEELNYSRASVSRGIHLLLDKNYITMDQQGFIELTKTGKEIAIKISTRHEVLTEALIYLGVSKEEAEENACRIEHVISEEVFNQIKAHVKKMKNSWHSYFFLVD